MNIYKSVEELIGSTPLLELTQIQKDYCLGARILAKLECFNPGGSVKDRAAKWMLNDAEEKGVLKAGGTIIEPTSGNTGIGLASIAAARGYRAIIVMPDTMSMERRILMAAYGAELVLTPGEKGMQGAIDRAKELAEEIPGSYIPNQFENPANPQAHYDSTAPEIWQDTEGNIDAFIAGVGTGGTISGIGKYLKEKNSGIRIVAVEPASSPVLSQGKTGSHGIQGIGAGFVPAALERSVIDEIICVEDEAALNASRMVGAKEGILCGISSGAALHGAIQLAQRKEMAGKTIVTLFPDNGERYLSTALYRERGL